MNGENDLMGGLSAAAQPMAQPMAQPSFELSPDVLARMNANVAAMGSQPMFDPSNNAAFDKYVADQAAKGVEVASTYAGGGGPLGATNAIYGMPTFFPAFDPANPGATTGQVVRFNQEGGSRGAPIVYQPGQNYVLTDASGENVVGRASSVEELQALAAAQKNMPYGFQLYRADEQGNYQPGTQLFGESDNRADGLMGALVKYGLPIAASFVPGLNVLTGAALAGGTTAAGNLMAGETANKALTSGLIAAGTAGLMKGTGLDKVIGGAVPVANKAAETGVNVAAQQGAQNAIQQGIEQGLITVTNRVGSNVLGNLASGAISSGLGNIGGSLATDTSLGRLADAYNQPPAAAEGALQPELVASASRLPNVDLSGLAGVATSMGSDAFAPDTSLGRLADAYNDPMLTSTAQRPSGDGIADELAAAGVPAATIAAYIAAQGSGAGPLTASQTAEVGGIGGNAPTGAPLTAGTAGTAAGAAGTAAKVGGVSAAAKKIIGGLTLLDMLGNVLGGGKKAPTTPGGPLGAAGTRASLSPIFSAKLPAVSSRISSFAPRDMSGVDFSRYGYGPEQSFFENVPRNPQEYRAALAAQSAPPAAAQLPSDEITSYIRRMVPGVTDEQIAAFMQTPEGQELLGLDPNVVTLARGGMLAAKGGTSSNSRAVKGPGTGRSDDIPALLSDGEYVIDAETVAMLGDGSSEAGAKRLDDFRVSIRKHKGRNLAKGEFSANAKRPENYLSGGLV
jgi:hypothetical protein